MRLAGVRTLLAAAALVASAPAAGQGVEIPLVPGETLLEVQGEGTFRSRPDRMEIIAGVVTTGPTAREALDANSALANRLIDLVRSGGIPPSAIQTTDLSVTPRFEREEPGEDVRPRIIGYVATNNVEIELAELDRASDLLEALLTAGANNVRGPIFSLADDSRAIAAARGLAVANARAEANAYAEAFGMRVSRVLRVSERSARVGAGGDRIMVTGGRIGRGAPVEPGEIETGVTVWVDYALVPQ